MSNRFFPPWIPNFCHYCRKILKSGIKEFFLNLHFCNIKECGSMFARIRGRTFLDLQLYIEAHCMRHSQTKLKEPFWLQIGSHSPILYTYSAIVFDIILLHTIPVELYKSSPSGSHSYTFMLVMIALLVGKGAKCPNDSLGSLKSSLSFLCVE